jgi:hypothetical protein
MLEGSAHSDGTPIPPSEGTGACRVGWDEPSERTHTGKRVAGKLISTGWWAAFTHPITAAISTAGDDAYHLSILRR